jgi:putative transposase
MNKTIFKTAPHNPPHLFLPDALYMLTASTYNKIPLMQSQQRKQDWTNAFREAARMYQWQIIAWVVLNNHYHALLRSPENVETLSKFIASYHKYTAHKWNAEDEMNERKVWWNYWDTCIRSEYDLYNRLSYIFWNPVKHELVQTPEEYAFSNYDEFMLNWQIEFNFINMDEVNDVPEF